MSEKIHHTRGIYPNGSHKDNGVAAKDLESHKEYNLTFRPGRALLIDGKCVYPGINVSQEIIDKHEAELAAKPKVFEKATLPYQ